MSSLEIEKFWNHIFPNPTETFPLYGVSRGRKNRTKVQSKSDFLRSSPISIISSFPLGYRNPARNPGIMVTKESLQKYFELSNIETKLSPRELCFLWGMILLKEEGIITIPAVGMPGASETIRFDLSSKDVIDIDLDILYQKISKSFTRFLNTFNNISEVKDLYFTKHL